MKSCSMSTFSIRDTKCFLLSTVVLLVAGTFAHGSQRIVLSIRDQDGNPFEIKSYDYDEDLPAPAHIGQMQIYMLGESQLNVTNPPWDRVTGWYGEQPQWTEQNVLVQVYRMVGDTFDSNAPIDIKTWQRGQTTMAIDGLSPGTYMIVASFAMSLKRSEYTSFFEEDLDSWSPGCDMVDSYDPIHLFEGGTVQDAGNASSHAEMYGFDGGFKPRCGKPFVFQPDKHGTDM